MCGLDEGQEEKKEGEKKPQSDRQPSRHEPSSAGDNTTRSSTGSTRWTPERVGGAHKSEDCGLARAVCVDLVVGAAGGGGADAADIDELQQAVLRRRV
ncbi:hypothetical protein FI667_g781, partial [Globisporangium splendens]